MLTCRACDRGDHDACDGTAPYMEQDGPNRYVCQCFCRPTVVQRRCEACGGRGSVTVTIPSTYTAREVRQGGNAR